MRHINLFLYEDKLKHKPLNLKKKMTNELMKNNLNFDSINIGNLLCKEKSNKLQLQNKTLGWEHPQNREPKSKR
jgi:hypothetical protein